MKKLSLTLTVVTFIFLLQNLLVAQPNLILNGNFSAGNNFFSTMYPSCNTAGCMGACGCPPYFAVGTDANYYHGLLTGVDHTTGSGNFMIVDGGNGASLYLWRQTVTVTPNKNYTFSYWLSSLYPTSPANIQIVINGTNAGSPLTAPVTLNTWIKGNVPWNSGANTSATIDIYDLNTTFVGNDFGIDDISFTQNSVSSNSFISDVFPYMNSINVAKSSDIYVTFIQDMNASTINSSNIKVFGLQTGLKSASVSYNAGTKTATINPNADYKVGEKIQVTLTSGIQNSSNSPITQFTWTFTVQSLGGTGIFTETSVIDSVAIVNQYNGGELLKSADIDGDGDIDLVAENYYSSSINIFKNNGNGMFTSYQMIKNIPDVHWYSALNLGDYDNDGDIDLSFSTATPIFLIDSFYVYKNDGAGNFAKFSSMLGGGLGAEAADLDGDGDLDLAESWAFDNIRYFINDGNGNFTMHQISNLGYYHTNGLDVGDIDNDGDIDILASFKDFSGSNNKFLLLMNDGNTNFSTGNTFFTNNYYSNQRFADLNGDNYLDIAGWNYQSFNLGYSAFGQIFFGGGSEAVPFDFDGDGDIDLTYTTGQFGGPDDLVKNYKNNAVGSFSNFSNNIVGHNVNSVATGDFDNDGDLDMAADNSYGHSGTRSDISILLNNYTPLCVISGPGNIPIYSVHTYYSDVHGGFWALINYGNTAASISGSHINDSLVVNAGSVGGHFVLYYHNNTGVLCHLHVYVDDPLPVELSSFTSNVVNSDVILNWITASEFNNSGFDIERKSVNENWSKVGFVEGNGNISTLVNYTFTDKNLSSGNYNYRLKQIDFNGNFEYYELNGEVTVGVPAEFRLSQNYPNPFNPSTKINYELPNAGKVSLKVYDIVGKEVITLVNESQNAGRYSVVFNAANLPSGIYYYKITAGSFIEVRKMILIK